MPNIELRYGKSKISFDYLESQFKVLGNSGDEAALSDAEIGERLDKPFNSKPLEGIIVSGDSVLIVVPDATRQTASGQIVN